MNVNSYLINKYTFAFLNKTNVSDLVVATLNNVIVSYNIGRRTTPLLLKLLILQIKLKGIYYVLFNIHTCK